VGVGGTTGSDGSDTFVLAGAGLPARGGAAQLANPIISSRNASEVISTGRERFFIMQRICPDNLSYEPAAREYGANRGGKLHLRREDLEAARRLPQRPQTPDQHPQRNQQDQQTNQAPHSWIQHEAIIH